MEQLADFAPMVQILDVPVPQVVEQLVDVLQFFATCLPLMPSRLSMCPRSHRTASRRELWFVRFSSRSWRKQWVEVPTAVTHVPGSALCHDRHGHEWVRVPGPTGVCFWKVGTDHTQRDLSGLMHRQPRVVREYWARMTWTAGRRYGRPRF